jgi:hypothetical protein
MTGESVAAAASRCGVAYTTAFRWHHRFLAAPALDKPTRLNGIVEAGETFILESFIGRRPDLPRAARTRGGKPTKTGLSAEQIPVLVARDRAGATIDAVLPKLDRVSVTAVLSGVVTPANQLCIDGGKAIAAFARVGGHSLSCAIQTRRPKTRRAGVAHQQCQRLPQPPQGMAASVSWRSDQKPFALSRLAPNA